MYYRPGLAGRTDALVEALRELNADVLVVDRMPATDVLRNWRRAGLGEPVVVVQISGQSEAQKSAPNLPTMDPISPALVVGGVPVLSIPEHPDTPFRALALAERYLLEQAVRTDAAAPAEDHRFEPDGSVLVVGAGVVGLVAAWHLGRSGYQVTVLDAGPDPRLGGSWVRSGCSWGGENARMFTLTEADDYHDHVPGASHAHRVFEQPPSRSGWDIRRRHDLPTDHAWVQEFKRVPPWLARGYNHDIFGLNRRSGELWDDWLRSDPEFFASAHLRQDVLRLYEDPGHFEEALVRQHQVGATLAHYRPEQIRERWPTLAEAAPDAFAGGILVRGFTVNVHDFLRRLVEDLEASGSHVRFDVRVTAVRRDGRDRVSGVQTTDGPYAARHYLISPGVYGNDLLEGTLSDAQIHGVLGCWATVPDLGPSLENSLKVGRRGHIVEDANVTVAKDREGRPILIVGSGYGWTGSDPTNIEQSELDALHRGVADTIRRLFPRAYEAVGGEPGLRASQTFCVRPWTASNLGLFETVPAGSGVVVIADGHNTGGFAQAPVIAEAVLAAVQGKHHPMHALYHPGRTDLALGRRVDVGQGVP